MGKKRVKAKPKAAPKRARKAKPNAHLSKKSKRQRVKKKTRLKSKRPHKTNRRSTRSKQKTRLSGNSTTVIVDSRYAGRSVTVLRKTTSFTPSVKIPRGANGVRYLRGLMLGSALKHFKTIGKSEKNYFYLRFQYSYRRNSKDYDSRFSIGIAKLRNADQFTQYFEDTLESFLSSLIGYSRDGFETIRLTKLIVQGYKK